MMAEDYKKEFGQRIIKHFLDIQILKLIIMEPMWGYKIKKTLEADWGTKLTHSALYPSLKQLEENGLIFSQKQNQQGRDRKVYAPTERGKMYLQCYYSVIEEQIRNRKIV
ncbi:MAG: PadR family transcriptional regulator [Candidatus Bathyarchaeota archaeon]|nr:PadR family transcriptional regulator [Candidatus Bathyarchaeota archaeon]